MAFILVLMLMVDGQVSDSRSFAVPDRQLCEQKGQEAVEYYQQRGAHVKFMCVRPI